MSRTRASGFPGGLVIKNRLAMWGKPVRFLVWEDPTSRGATRPLGYNYWAFTLEPTYSNCWRPECPRPCAPQQRKPPQWEALRREPLLFATIESPRTATNTQCSQKTNKKRTWASLSPEPRNQGPHPHRGWWPQPEHKVPKTPPR